MEEILRGKSRAVEKKQITKAETSVVPKAARSLKSQK